MNQYINVLNGFGRARIIEFESSTVVKTVVEVPFFEASVAIASGSWELETGYEAVFSSSRGFPRTLPRRTALFWWVKVYAQHSVWLKGC